VHLYVIRLQLDLIGKTHRAIFEALRVAGIGVNLHYIPVYLQPYYANLGFNTGYCPEAENYYTQAISLPIFPSLTLVEQDQVVSMLSRAISRATAFDF
jgi:dTDP-4-amino-4,6-dideoxygalactose transaminase